MYTRILVPLDGSKTAEAVLPYARLLAAEHRIPVELLTVIDVIEASREIGGGQSTHFDAVNKESVRKTETYLSGVARSFQGENISCTVEKGVTAGAIIGKAGADKGTLIAMATHGRSGLKRWLLGSIAEKVLRAANNPLLLARANEKAATDGKASLDSVIVPLDGSELAESILPTVVELAKAIDLKLRLVRSYHTWGMTDEQLRWRIVGDFNYQEQSHLKPVSATLRNEATSYLDAKVQALKTQGLNEVASFASEGEPAETIIETAREAPNSLIAMCTHGRSGVQRWVLGSVTEKVVRHSSNPVLVVRAA